MAKPVNKPFSTRLPEEIRTALRSLAESKGLTEADLGRMFIIEKLKEVNEGRSLAALIIAALSDEYDTDQAEDLITQYLATKATVAS